MAIILASSQNARNTMDEIRNIPSEHIGETLKELENAPEHLWVRGTLPQPGTKLLGVIGSRKHTEYGKAACAHIMRGLAGSPISIVSGLALGIDALAHKEALKNNLHAIAIPGSGLHDSVIYPASHRNLAHQILGNGGCLVSIFEPKEKANRWTFPKRNALLAGIVDALLVIEAGERSGTSITVKYALEYNKEICVIPGSIFSSASTGANRFIKEGARVCTDAKDIQEVLGLQREHTQEKLFVDTDEKTVLERLGSPKTKSEILQETGLSPQDLSKILAKLEIKGYIQERLGKFQKST